jgi:hypothetical protein
MKALCIRSHEKPMGVVYHAGRVYELDAPGPHFAPVDGEPPPPAPKKRKKGGKRS